MDNIATYLNVYYQSKKTPPHEQAAKVDEIVKIVGLNKPYNYQYWLKKVKPFSFTTILEICKDASNLDSKYNIGGFITNRLSCKKIIKK